MATAIGSEVKGAFVFPVLSLVLLSIAGCGTRDGAFTPQADDVDKITITVTHPLVKGAAPCEAILTKRDAIVPVLDWLKGIDWSQGEDMAPMRLPEPDGRLVIRLKNGTEEFLNWYWDGKVTSPRRNLLVRMNPTALQKVILDACP
jgi:hypothetical protein